MWEWLKAPEVLSWAQVASALVTAAATVALWRVTAVLAVETRRLAKAQCNLTSP